MNEWRQYGDVHAQFHYTGIITPAAIKPSASGRQFEGR